MELRNIATGGQFSCDDVMGERLLGEGGYEKVGAAAAAPEPVKDAPRKAPVRRAPAKKTAE